MNHLKHIRAISVPFCAPSNAALPSRYGQHADVYFENCQLKSQLLQSDPLSVANRNRDVDVKYSGRFRQDSLRLVSKESRMICKQRSKTKSSVTSLKKKSSMHKKLPSGNIAKTACHYSTYQNAKFNSNGISKQQTSRGVAIINGAKDINRRSSFIASVEKHPRSYAEMIADYSESLHKESTVGARNGSLRFNNAIRKSPFSTFAEPSSSKKIFNVAKYSELSTEGQKNDFSLPVKLLDPCNRYNNINAECHNTCTADVMNKDINRNCVITNVSKSDDQSYAKLIADCNKSMHDIPVTSILNDVPVSRKDVLTRNSSVATRTRKVNCTHTQATLRKIIPTVSTMPLEKNPKGQEIDLKANDWLKEMENAMNDLKSAAKRKIAEVVDVPKRKESDILQTMDASGNSLDRVHRLTELVKSHKQKEKDIATKKLNYQSDKIDKMEKRKKDLEMQKQNYSYMSDKISGSPDYFSNAAKSSTVRKNSTHVSISDNTGILKQPQIKLRMVPSEKESVVSINVDQASNGSLDPASKHLSVIVQSGQKEDLQLTNNQRATPTLRRSTKSASQRSDFGPMRISISEDSAPVKQIEFSINGKPVSELKSIIARTERLDVVSSADKIEIRIPFAKDDSNALDKTREGDLSKGINSSIGQILNVQISANFQNQLTKDSAEKPAEVTRYQHDKITIPKSSSPISMTPYLFNDFSKAEKTLSSNNIQQHESFNRMNIKSDNAEKDINKHRTSDDVDFKVQRKTTKNLSPGITGISLIKEVNNVEVGSLNMRKANTTRFPETNKYDKNKSSDNRVSSKMIPWWSSSDSFSKIRKTEDDHKSLPPSNQNGKKAVSSLNKNLITESLLSKPKETSHLKIVTKETQSMNNATVTTNDSSNIISYSNSMKPYEESISTLHYPYSSRLKPNRGNPVIIPEIIRNGFKGEDNQALTAKKDVNKMSEIKQAESVTLSIPDTMNMNMKGEHDVSVKEKVSVLRRNTKTPSSAQNLSPKRNQRKKDNYSLKQTKSIDDVSSIKSRIKDILDAIKPIEKRKDGTLIDYGLKMLSRKPTVRSNEQKRAQSPSPVITTKNLISNSSITERVSKEKETDKTMSTKQIESTKTKKLTMKTDVLPEKKNLLVKNVAIIDVKGMNKNGIRNIKEVTKRNSMSSSSSNFRNSPELTQKLKKQEKLADNIIVLQDKSRQDLKSLLEVNKNELSSSSNIRTSSGTIQKSEKLEMSRKMSSEESKQNRPKSLSSIKNTPETIQESEKLRGLTTPKLKSNLDKESADTKIIDGTKLPLQTVNQIHSKSSINTNTNKIANINKLSSSQTISHPTSKIKDQAGSNNLMDKNARKMPIIQSVKNNKIDVGDMIARIVTQNPKSKDPLSKDCKESCFNKSRSGKDKGNLPGSAGSSRKPNNSVVFKSAGSKPKSRVISNDMTNNCTYEKKVLFMESFYSNFNRKNNIISNSQSTVFKVRRDLNDIDVQHPAPAVIANDGSWINIDRPEKSILYSAWLQRSENDGKKNKKLF